MAVTVDDVEPIGAPGSGSDAGGITWIEVAGDAGLLGRWLTQG